MAARGEPACPCARTGVEGDGQAGRGAVRHPHHRRRVERAAVGDDPDGGGTAEGQHHGDRSR